MRSVLAALLQLAIRTEKIGRSDGVTNGDIGESHAQAALIVLRRARKRAPNLTLGERQLCELWSIFLGAGRMQKVESANTTSVR